MHPQLAGLLDEYKSALQQAHALQSTVPYGRWAERPEPTRWSIGECIAHLNLTSEAFLAPIRVGLAAARAQGRQPRDHYRRDFAGWLLSVILPPPVRMRVRTPAPFVPQGVAPPSELMAAFDRYQAEFVACVRDADGLPIDKVDIPSPFNPRFHYNIWSALVIIPRHQARHLWQAEQVWSALQAK